MKITIQRILTNEHAIDGQLWIDNMKACDTAESAINCLPTGVYEIRLTKCVKAVRKIPRIDILLNPCCSKCCKIEETRFEIYGKEYDSLKEAVQENKSDEELKALECNLTEMTCSRLKRHPSYYCPQIRSGNGVFGVTDGSILLGTYLAPGIVKKSRQAFDAIYERIRKNIERGKCVSLEIKN